MTLKNGDLVYCTSGHVVCEVVDASKLRDTNLWGDAFGRWRMRQKPPTVGGPMPTCELCGAQIVWPKG